MDPRNTVILIPSLEPDDRLPPYVARLREQGFQRVVIVDDGSSEGYQPIFAQLDAMDGCTVLHHEVNRGKGCALKTGYQHILEHMPEACGVITADADGQHTVEDCWRLAQALAEGANALYLGSRDFSLPQVPFKSRAGNRITSLVFLALYGHYLPDTQTGLRAFRREELPFMIGIEGERFEYEMNVLIACARRNLPMTPITILTVYENDNAGTHFHPVRDSIRIYRVILGNFLQFILTSIASFVIDIAAFAILEHQVFRGMLVGQEFFSTIVARLISAPCNFLMNKKLVFKSHARCSGWKYAVLSIGVLLSSAISLELLMNLLSLPEAVATPLKLLVDLTLYLISYQFQHKWVFKEENRP